VTYFVLCTNPDTHFGQQQCTVQQFLTGPCCLQAAIRKRAPDVADQYIGVSTQPEPVADSASQGDMLDRCIILP